MPLKDTGARRENFNSVSAHGEDQKGKEVTVIAALEVVEDHGWEKIWPVASRKYDDGDFETAQTRPIVTIRIGDV